MNQITIWPEQQYYTFDAIREMEIAINAQGVTRYGRPARVRIHFATSGVQAEVITLDGVGVIRVSWGAIALRLNNDDTRF